MSNQYENLLSGETLIPLAEAAKDFGGVAVPLETLKNYVYRGFRGLKLETISINGRYTSKEAILRFLERKQCPECELPKKQRLTQQQVDDGLRRHGIIE